MAGESTPLAPSDAPQLDASTERIIDAALEEMAVHGPSRARMAAIAQRAGVSSATLYRRFAAKQDLMQAVTLREVERYINAMSEVAIKHDTAEELVVECFAFGLEYLQENTIIHQLIDAEPELVLPMLTTGAGPLIATTTDFMLKLNEQNIFVEEALWQRDLAKVRLEMVVRLFISLLMTPGYAIDIDTPEASREFARRHIVPLVVQAKSPQVRRPIRT